MSLDLFRSLTWLQAPPPDFSARCRAVLDQNSETALGLRLQQLASFALDENQLNHLARVISKAQKTHTSLQPLVPFRLGVLSNSTLDFIVPALVATAARARFYQDNAKRVGLQNQVGDLNAYLASLQMEITFQPFDEIGRARITQLINKSNQYNLTTKRYTEPEVAAVQHDPQCFTLQVRLSDSFGDNGMISVIICRQQAYSEWEIDTWLMSCRVVGRRVEQMVLREILEHARRNGIRKLIGAHRPTDRNKLVEDHYSKLGFTLISTDADETRIWELDVDTAAVEAAPMTVRSIGFMQETSDVAHERTS
jgi:hypothetical protein